jgi:hypothetical protein
MLVGNKTIGGKGIGGEEYVIQPNKPPYPSCSRPKNIQNGKRTSNIVAAVAAAV